MLLRSWEGRVAGWVLVKADIVFGDDDLGMVKFDADGV